MEMRKWDSLKFITLIAFWLLLIISLTSGFINAQSDYPTAPSFRFPLPAGSYALWQDFGENDYDGQPPWHLAEDYGAPGWTADLAGTPVYAAANGLVKYTHEELGEYAGIVIIEHTLPDSTKVCTLYGHLSKSLGLLVSPNNVVRKGQIIAYVAYDAEDGSDQWKPHLHFGIRKGGYTTAQTCGYWAYVGYSKQCSGVTHNDYLEWWWDPTDFVDSHQCPYGTADSSVRWHADGTLIRAPNAPGDEKFKVYLIHDGKKKHVTNGNFLSKYYYGFDWKHVIEVEPEELDCFPTGENIDKAPKLQRANGNYKVYLIFNDQYKRWIKTEEVLKGLGYSQDDVEVVSSINYPDDPAAPVLESPYPDGTLIRKYDGTKVYVITNGKKRGIETNTVFNKLGYNWNCIVDEEVSVVNNIDTIDPEIDEDRITQCGGQEQTLSVSLTTNPDPPSGVAPLDVEFTADVSGTATGTINYTFWWDCNDPGKSVGEVTSICGDPTDPAIGAKFDNTDQDPKVVYHTYWDPGTYTAKVIAERGSANPAEDRVTITVQQPSDTTPPTPDPMTWATEPYETSTSSISMVATTASDPSTPIYYQFDFTSSPTGGSGGTDSSWRTSTSYTDSGLGANHQYGYRVKARDNAAAQNTTDYSSVSYDYTDIETPSGITFGTIMNNSIQARSTNTPSGLTRGSSGLIIYNITKGTNSGWKQNNNYWTSSSLSVNTRYGFRAKARNGDGDETPYCSTAYKYTLANPPGASAFSNITQTSIQANWTANGNPSGTEYFCENTTKGTNSGWTTNKYWNSTGLSCGTSYSFRVKTRNGDGVETGWTNLGSQSTQACGGDTTPPDTSITGGPSGIIDYNDVTFTYTGSDNVTPTSELVYSYKLEGYDSSWSSYSSGTSKTYYDLPNGSYTFYVKAKDQAGNVDPSPDSQSFTVEMCTYSISPTSKSFDKSGGSGTVNVTTQDGCTWDAISNKGWITITGGSSGTGSGTVNYSVSANGSTSQRTGTMTIAGETFTVTQSSISAHKAMPWLHLLLLDDEE